MALSIEEARLVASYRAITRFGHPGLISIEDASTVSSYLADALSLDDRVKSLSEKEIELLLDGYIAGIAANRLMTSDITAAQYFGQVKEPEPEYQTGVDPVSGEVRT